MAPQPGWALHTGWMPVESRPVLAQDRSLVNLPSTRATARWYTVTLLALVVHQIDAAYWQEWEMFGVPGGIQGFLVFNAVAVGALVCGYQQLLLGGRWARQSVMLCGALGVATAALHIGFAVAGRDEFHLPLSIAVIAVCGVAGVVLLCRIAPRSSTV